MNDNLLSVPQFAKMATRSKQSIYEAVRNKNSRLYPYVVMRDKRAYIKAAALKLYQDGSHQDNQTGTGSRPGLAEQIIEILQEQIREKDREIQEKNRQLAEKDNQINKLIELANHAQLLHAATKREQLEEAATQPEPVIDTAPIETKKKRSLWARLFGGE